MRRKREGSVNVTLIKITIIIGLLFTGPGLLSARGAIEAEREYQSLVKSTFDRIISAVDAREMSADEGKQVLNELRNRYNRYYNDESGILDALIDQVEEKELTADEAAYYFTLLRENRLMEHRLERGNGGEEPGDGRQNNGGSSNESGSSEQDKGEKEGEEQQRRSS